MTGRSIDRLRTKAAQVVFPRLGSNMPPPVRVTEDIDRFRPLQQKYQFGGLVLFNGSVAETPGILAELQQTASRPLLVASDIERGAGQQIAGATLFPHARACAIAGREAVANFARITALEALACGLHITFGPVADVNANPRNPIIGIRSFGDDAASVAAHVRTYIETCASVGLLTTAKHFPGHGDTATDSHAMLPVVDKNEQALAAVEYPPFVQAIDTGVDLVMTAHVAFPHLDDNTTPATLSAPILQSLLRQKLAFKGAIISDSLIMNAIQPADGNMARYAANLLNAGLDILLDPLEPVAMVEGIVQAIAEGLLPESRLDAAIGQVEALRTRIINRFGAAFFTNPQETFAGDLAGAVAHQEAAKNIATKAISEIRPGTPTTGKKQLALFVTPYRTRLDPEETPVGKALTQIKRTAATLVYHEIDASTPEQQITSLISSMERYDEAIVFVVSKPAAWHAYGLPEALSRFVADVTRKLPNNACVSW